MDPYAVLGVGKNATERDLKRARRKIAAKAHPDRNPRGAELMAEANLAFDILSDPVRRANFDQTGAHRVSTEEEEAYKLIMQGFQQYLLMPNPVNVPKAMTSDFRQMLEKGRRTLADLERNKVRFEKRRDEHECTDRMDLWRGLIDQHLEGLANDRAKLEREMRVIELAIERLKCYRSKVESDPWGNPMAAGFPSVLTGRK